MANDWDYIQKTVRENWRREMEAAQLYQMCAGEERDSKRRDILQQLADVEFRHAAMWENKARDLGGDPSQWVKPTVRIDGMNRAQLLGRIEGIEEGNAAWYQSLRHVIEDPEMIALFDQIEADEKAHADVDAMLHAPSSVEGRLKKIWKGERHRQGTSDWVGDAIYGVNDGLGAIFGIIAGVAGFTANTHTVLVSGFFGALASTLSMGAGAWLATKSENEVMQTTMAQERREIEEDPAHEVEELALLYQLKGFSTEDSAKIARQIAADPDQFLKTMVQEEFGFHEASQGNPWKSALYGSVSTLVGGIVPLIPFFFLQGWSAMLAAALVSIVAHFAVGAAKSLVTVRSWWASGLEMTAVGVIVGAVSYGLGELGAVLFGVAIGG